MNRKMVKMVHQAVLGGIPRINFWWRMTNERLLAAQFASNKLHGNNEPYKLLIYCHCG